MATFVGSSAWGPAPAVPAGVQQGDLLVLVTRAASVPGWKHAGDVTQIFRNMFGLVWLFGGQKAVPVLNVWVRHHDGSTVVPAGYGQVLAFRLAVWSGRQPVYGVAHGQAVAGGALLIVQLSLGAAATPAGAIWAPYGAITSLANGAEVAKINVGYALAAAAGEVGPTGTNAGAMTIRLDPPPIPSVELLSPDTGFEVSSAAELLVAWQYTTNVPGGRQGEVQLRRGGTEYWTGSAWSASPVSISTPDTELTLPPQAVGSLSLDVRARDAVSGDWSAWTAATVGLVVAPPTMTLAVSPSPLWGDLSPTVTWTRSTPRGDQIAWRIQAGQAGVVRHDSGWRSGDAALHGIPARTDWLRGIAVDFDGWVRQSGGSEGQAARLSLPIDWDVPALTAVTATATSQGVQIQITGDTGRVEVERRSDDGVWSRLVEFAGGGSNSLLDPFAPDATRYRARVLASVDGQLIPSDWVESTTGGLPVDVHNTDARGAYLALAADPLRTWLPVTLRQVGDREIVGEVSVMEPVTGGLLVDYGPILGESGSLVVLTETPEDAAALSALLAERATMLIRWPAERLADGSLSAPVVETIARSARHSRARIVQTAVAYRDHPIPFVTVATPPYAEAPDHVTTHPIL